MEQLARQHSQLEHQCKKTTMNSLERGLDPITAAGNTADTVVDDPRSSECTTDDEDDFQDAVTDQEYVEFRVSGAPVHRRTMSSVSSQNSGDVEQVREEETDYSSDQEDPNILTIVKRRAKSSNGGANGSINMSPVKRTGRERRSRIPDKPDISFSLWSIMKNCIGKDLSKIPIPVNFSEPISFLQRLNEDFEYSEVLDRAAAADDDHEQLALVAAFTVSSYRLVHLINNIIFICIFKAQCPSIRLSYNCKIYLIKTTLLKLNL